MPSTNPTIAAIANVDIGWSETDLSIAPLILPATSCTFRCLAALVRYAPGDVLSLTARSFTVPAALSARLSILDEL